MPVCILIIISDLVYSANYLLRNFVRAFRQMNEIPEVNMSGISLWWLLKKQLFSDVL